MIEPWVAKSNLKSGGSVSFKFVHVIMLIALMPSYAICKPYSNNGFFIKLENKKSLTILKTKEVKKIEEFKYLPELYFVEITPESNLESVRKQMTKMGGVVYTTYNYFRSVGSKAIDLKSTDVPYPIEKPAPSTKWVDDPKGPVYAASMAAVPAVWQKYSIGNPDIIIADIDTGIDYNHKDLASNIWRNVGEMGFDSHGIDKRKNGVDDDNNGYIDDFIGWNFVEKNNLPWDDHSHGTHTAGIAAAVGGNGFGISGVCPRCSILPIRFIGASGSGEDIDAIRSVEYAIKMKANIINCSWGGKEESPALLEAFQAADRAGIILAVASGNAGEDLNEANYYPANYDLSSQLTTAALYTTDVFLPWWSNFGNKKVHTSIAGDMVESTVPENDSFAAMSGTSMAAPGIAGTAGLILSFKPQLKATEIKALMKKHVLLDKGSINKVMYKGRPDTQKIIEEVARPR